MSEGKAEMIARLAAAEAWVPGKRVRIDFGGTDGAVLLDGVGKRVSDATDPADATLHVGWSDWLALGDGKVSPMMALLTGRMRIEGDMLAAMQLSSVLKRVKR